MDGMRTASPHFKVGGEARIRFLTYDGLFGWLVSLACVEHKHCLRGVFVSAPSLKRTNGCFSFSFLCQAGFFSRGVFWLAGVRVAKSEIAEGKGRMMDDL